VGWSQTAEHQPLHAFLWEKGVMTDLGTLGNGGNSRATDINAAGQVVGQSNGSAVLWDHGNIVELGPGIALGVNARGDVVGQSIMVDGDAGSRYHATLWTRK
jgi:probable HAF family extracellular repeat protein